MTRTQTEWLEDHPEVSGALEKLDRIADLIARSREILNDREAGPRAATGVLFCRGLSSALFYLAHAYSDELRNLLRHAPCRGDAPR